MSHRVLSLDDLDPISVAGVRLHPVRQALGISAFGINGFSADAGERLIEEHREDGGGAGRHEELYVVIRGRATFTVDGEELDAAAGTLVLVPPGSLRGAMATEDRTLALVIGNPPGAAGPISPWERYFVAAGEADPARAYAVAAEGLADHPDHPSLHYELAGFGARAGMRAEALEHLRRAIEGEPKARRWAAEDADLDSIRDDPGWPG